MKTLYEDDGSWSDESRRLAIKAEQLLEPLFRDYVEDGYSFRDISHVIASAVTDLELKAAAAARFGPKPE